MSVTIKDVAREANVSPSTVSRVIANSPRISDDTKEKVYSAIKKLNYHPNAIARSLANNSTSILGLILPNEEDDLFKNPFFIQAMTGISIYAQKMGFNIMYSFGKNEDDELNIAKKYTNSKLVDGIILLTIRHNDKVIKFLKEKNYPFVVVGRPENTDDILWVDNDNFKAMYNVVDLLISKGHRSIGFIGGNIDMNMSKDRFDGYCHALRIHGISQTQSFIVHECDFSEECGYNAMAKILSSGVPSALVTTDDLLAFGALKAIKEKGINISIVGFNNTLLSSYQTPSLSSVDINADKLGFHAAKLLVKSLKDESISPTHYIIETDFIERDSTKNITS